jgi:hypothetical protein
MIHYIALKVKIVKYFLAKDAINPGGASVSLLGRADYPHFSSREMMKKYLTCCKL